MPPGVNSYTTIGGAAVLNGADFLGADVAAGQTLSRTIGGFGPALASGVTRGTMTLRYSTGPSLDGALATAKVRVGSFAVKIP
jgi:hypothetical protein